MRPSWRPRANTSQFTTRAHGRLQVSTRFSVGSKAFGRKAEFLGQFLARGLPFSARLRSGLLRPRAHRINAEAAVIDGGNIANGWHEAAPPPEPAVAVNSRQLASAASHELHDSQDICPFLPRTGFGAKRRRGGGQGLRVRGLGQLNGKRGNYLRPGFSWYARLSRGPA